MKRASLLEHTRTSQLGLAAGLLLATLASGCDAVPGDTTDAGTSPVQGGPGGLFAGTTGGQTTPGGPTGGLGGVSGGFPTAGGTVTPGGTVATGGTVTPGGTSTPGGTTGGIVGAPGGTAGGGANGDLWCKAKTVLDTSCTTCHDGKGSSGSPMGLTKPEDFLAPAPISTGKKVYEAVSARTHDANRPMPAKGVLPAAQLADLDAWIAAGVPAPSGTCAPTVTNTVAWPPSNCDAIYKLTSHGDTPDSPYTVQPGGEFHPQVMIDAPWGDETVQVIQFHPITDNSKVLHHWILYGQGAVGGFLSGWAPGDNERSPFPPDVGMEMPRGAQSMRLDLHYNSLTATKPENDRSGVEVCVVKGKNLRPKPAAVMMGFVSLDFPLAPANTVNHDSTGVCNVTVTEPVTVMTAGPHAHTYARHMKFTVKKKNGTEIVMHDQPFQFGEQGTYTLTPPVILETGDVVTTTCTYTNNTNVDINFGENTEDEMCFNFASYYPKDALSCDLLGGLFGGAGGLIGL